MTPLEILIKQKRDEASQNALVGGLRRNRDIGNIAMLSGDPVLSPFGKTLSGDVDTKLKLKMASDEKEKQRVLQKSYYGQLASQNAATQQHRGSVLTETMRHNKAMEDAANLRAQQSVDKPMITDVRRLSQDLAKANIPEVAEGIDLVNKELEKYQGKNIPGVGGLANVFPGMGEKSKHIKSLIGRIRNIILKARSGGAVTPQEADRLMEEFSLNPLGTDTSFLKAWADFQQVFGAGVKNIYSGYRPEVVDLYGSYQQQNEVVGPPDPSQEEDIYDWETLNAR